MGDNDSKKIFIMGDYVNDLILVNERRKAINYSFNFDLFTRDVINSFNSSSGVETLEGIIKEYDKFSRSNSFEILAQTSKDITSQTISEWREENSRLFLEHHIGLMGVDENIKIFGTDLENLGNCECVAVYNMSGCAMEIEPNGAKNAEEAIVEKLAENTRLKLALIRTMFLENQKYTNLVEKISQNEDVSQKTILLFNVNELRRGNFNITKGLSWEQLVKETVCALEKIENLSKFKAIVVCFNHEGCLIIEGETKKLICYNNEIEGDYVLNVQKRVFSPILTMQAVLIIGLQTTELGLEDIVTIGLKTMRDLITNGFTKNAKYPYDYIVGKISQYFNNSNDITNTPVSISVKGTDGNVEFEFNNGQCTSEEHSIIEICKSIVRFGPSGIEMPYLRLGNLITFDKNEVEQLRSIHQLFRQYISDHNITNPFSICVFGQPGSGKSFAVKQIAKSLKINPQAILEFNLSQMSSLEDLCSAFHQIRDAGLRGELPLVFFDEFDSEMGTPLGWIKYFLAPMQDGEFREKAIAHFIGRAIFVFAGGTCYTTKQFMEMQNSPNAKENKLPDFLSRIKGYIDVTGPNPLLCDVDNRPDNCWLKSQLLDKKEHEIGEVGPYICQEDVSFITKCGKRHSFCIDNAHYLRRATLLRSLLEEKLGKSDGDEIKIEDNVLDAFLKVSNYLHGARSMQAIIQMSDVSSAPKFTVSNIYNNYLNLYVTDDFEEYLNKSHNIIKETCEVNPNT